MASKEKAGTEVATVKTGGLVAAPEFMGAEDFGVGFEGTDKDSFAIPFLQILQKMSPLVDDDSPKKMEGAKAGMVYNTVTQKLHDVRETPLEIVPVFYKRSFILWGARDNGGGFKGEITPEEMDKIIADDTVVNDNGKWLVKDKEGEVNPKKSDHYLDTRSHYVIAIDPDTKETMPAIVSLASSQIKSSKMLLTALQNKRVDVGGVKRMPAMYANKVKFTTVANSNEKGSWAGAKFELDGLVMDRELFAVAKEFYVAVSTGAVKADYSKSADTGEGDVSGAPKEAEGF